MSNNKISKENRRHLKNEIENLLSTISSDDNEGMLIDNELSDELKPESPYDFEEMSSQFTEKAKNITDSLFKNFVDLDIFDKNDYARYKKELDTINISNLFFQLKTIKITIMKVMEEITSGNTHPRLLEVMGQLQDKLASITKTQANYMLFLEDTYKKLNDQAPVNDNTAEINSSTSEGQFFVSVGTKNVINSLPESDLTDDLDDSKSLIDPRNKEHLLKKTDLDITVGDSTEGDDFIDLTEII